MAVSVGGGTTVGDGFRSAEEPGAGRFGLDCTESALVEAVLGDVAGLLSLQALRLIRQATSTVTVLDFRIAMNRFTKLRMAIRWAERLLLGLRLGP